MKRLQYSGDFDETTIEKVLSLLSQGIGLPQIYRDHELKGDFSGQRECHIKSDLLLLYEIDSVELFVTLADIGSHSDLFG